MEAELASRLQKEQFEQERRNFQNIQSKLAADANDSLEQSKINAATIDSLRSKLEGEWDEFRNNYKGLFARGEFLKQSRDFKEDSERYF